MNVHDPSDSLWRHPTFMTLWAAQAVSLLGSQVTTLALPLAAVVLLRASPLQVGLLGSAQYLAFLIIGLPAGVFVDQVRRKPILIASDVLRALTLLLIPGAYALGILHVFLLYPIAFTLGIFTVFFDVASQSYLPSLLRPELVPEANAKLQFSMSASQLAGPTLGGALVQALTAPIAVLADAISFILSATLLMSMRHTEAAVTRRHDLSAARFISDIAAGVAYVFRHKYIRPIALVTGIGNVFGLFGMIQAVLVIYAVRDLGLSSALLGVTVAIGNVGAIVAVLVNGFIVRAVGVGPTIVVSGASQGATALLMTLARPTTAMPVLSIALGVGAFGVALYNINQITLRQTVTPLPLQGRMNATIRVLIWGPIPVGAALGGALAMWLGVRPTLLVAGIGGIAAGMPSLFSKIRSLRCLPTPRIGRPSTDSQGFDG